MLETLNQYNYRHKTYESDFFLSISDKLDQSEQKLYQVSEMKKREVSEQISRVIEQIRLLEEEFHNEIEEFKNNRLS